MAAEIEAQNLEALRERRLRIPKPVVRAQRVGKNQQRKIVPAFQPEIDPGAAGVCETAHGLMLTQGLRIGDWGLMRSGIRRGLAALARMLVSARSSRKHEDRASNFFVPCTRPPNP